MKTCLVAINSKYIHENLAVHSLRAYARSKGEDCDICEFTINQTHEYVLSRLYDAAADIYAFSVYIWNVSFVYRIIDDLAGIRPDARIWLGGPEVSYDSHAVMMEHPSVSVVMRGEGEETFAQLLKAYKVGAGRDDRATAGMAGEHLTGADIADGDEVGADAASADKADDVKTAAGIADSDTAFAYMPGAENILGITYRCDDGSVAANADRPPIDMDELVFPYVGMDFDPTRIYYYESSRGCPYSCSYCLSSIDKGIRFRDAGAVKDEIRYFLSKGIRQVKFVDRTFNCNPERAHMLWQFLKDNDNGITNFHFEISGDLLREQDIELLTSLRPGQVQLEIGVQTTNPLTLKAIRRKADFRSLMGAVRCLIHAHNIHIHLDLIAGLPYEDMFSFRRSFNDVYALKPLQLQLGFLKVLKGTEMEAMIRDMADDDGMGCDQARSDDAGFSDAGSGKRTGYRYSSYPPYEVLSTPWMAYAEMAVLKGMEEMVELFYNSRQFENTMALLEKQFDDYFDLYYWLSLFYRRKHYDEAKHARVKLYEIMLEFIRECGLDASEYVPLLLMDAYAREKLKHFPEWAAGYEHTVSYDYGRRDPLTYNAYPVSVMDHEN